MPSCTDAFTVSAPGRICLFGEQQANLDLDAIAMAVDLRTTIQADSAESDDGCMEVRVDGSTLRVIPGESEGCDDAACYLWTAARFLAEKGASFPRGYRFLFDSGIPSGRGLAGTASKVVAWILALLRASDQLESWSGNDIAAFAHEVHGAAVDTYACSLGGKIHVRQDKSVHVDSLTGADLGGFVLGYPTNDPDGPINQGALAQRTEEAMGALAAVLPSFDLQHTPLDEAAAHLSSLPKDQAGIVYAHLTCRGICAQASEMLHAQLFERDRLGEMIDEAHGLLRDYLHLSTDQTEDAITAAKAVGALGARACATGSAVLAYAPDEEKAVADTIQARGWQAHILSQADGARLDAGALKPPWV